MIVYKFGGASVRNVEGIKNLANILDSVEDNLVIVVSAFGKTTNALEDLVHKYFNNLDGLFDSFESVKKYHLDILDELFQNKGFFVFKDISGIFDWLKFKIKRPSTTNNYDFIYDQIVCFGEILSTTIVSAYLNYMHYKNEWIDIRECLLTDNNFREGNVDWTASEPKIKARFNFDTVSMYVTQGFIGATKDNLSTTLGREGSDYTAAILSNMLNAEKTVIWKDVPGILNADPTIFAETEKLDEISYQEAIELSFSGAKVIHPKTIKPLHNKNIPLFVKSFIDPLAAGTKICNCQEYSIVPVFIIKQNQLLLSILPKDFSFVVEDSLSKIFALLFTYRIKVNLIQHSAISISVCVDRNMEKVEKAIGELRQDFKVLYNEGLELITIRHYTNEAIDKMITGREIYVEQRTRHSIRFVVK